MLRKASWDVERQILLGIYETILPGEWMSYRRSAVCRFRTKTLTLPPRLRMNVM